MGASIADFDGDGLVDIFVTHDKLANFFFRNLGGGRFREMAFAAAVAYTEDGRDISGMGADFRDVDNGPISSSSRLRMKAFPFTATPARACLPT